MTEHMTFTPGPWLTEYRKSRRGVYAQEVFDKDGEVIAVASWYPVRVNDTKTATNREANARLIAAAPELLEALQGLLAAVDRSICDGSGPAQDIARAAIAKALGE